MEQASNVVLEQASNIKSLFSFTSNAYGRDKKEISRIAASGARQPAFSFASNGFITCSQSDTDFKKPFSTINDIFAKWDRQERFFQKRRLLSSSSDLRKDFLLSTSFYLEPSCSIGFKTRRYRSGEVTGAQFATGRQFKVIPPSRSGAVETTALTAPAKTKIRRAVECADTNLRYFCTLTFAPAMLHPWEKNVDGTVRHDFAKWKLRKFLKACRMQQSRLKRELNYVWVAEIQGESTGNIHFHIIWDQFFDIKWMSKIWGQASNSVDIERLNNADHAANYMRKYITKGEDQAIQGNRYFIAHKLREDMAPQERMLLKMSIKDHRETEGEKLREMRELLQAMKKDIEAGGGHVFDFGFHISRARAKRRYRDKQSGEEKETKAVSPYLGKSVISSLSPVHKTGYVPF